MSSKRVPFAVWKTMTPAQQARLKSRLGTKKRYPSRYPLSKNLNTLNISPVLSIKHRSKLIYNDNRTITTSGAAANAYVFSANGLYDPDISGAGHQPIGFDQLMALYEHYTVTNCKITVNFVNESASENCYVGIAIFPDATVETGATKLIENGLMKRGWLAAKDSNSKSQCILSHNVKISKMNGRPESIVGDDLFRGDTASNPTEQTYLHLFLYNLATINSVTVRFDAIIEYDAVFTEPRKLAQS